MSRKDSIMAEPNGWPLGQDARGLRERVSQRPEMPLKAQSVDTAQEAVHALNAQEAAQNKKEKDKKTYGRTLDGTGEYLQCSPKHGIGQAFVVAVP